MTRQTKNRKEFSAADVKAAAQNWDKNPGWNAYSNSKNYDVIIDGKRYPPMPIIAFANEAAGNGPISEHFKGFIKGWGHRTLEKAGYPVVRKGETPPGQELEEDITQIVNTTSSSTERNQLIQARIGQGKFRADLMEYWEAECAVLGIACQELLRASHIRRWADCKEEYSPLRLDPENGLLLSANLDCLFESGLISFDARGKLLKHKSLEKEVANAVGISKSAKLRKKPTTLQAVQLAHHRARFGF